MFGCVLSKLNSSSFAILSFEIIIGLQPRTFFTAKNEELLGLYPIRNALEVSVM